MPFKGKYLKFNSNITFEIFEKIYNKLNEEKWYCKNSIKTEYSWFPKYGYITHEEPQEQRNFATHTCIYGLEETTVQEILGYDPFIKEEFTLPEKWAIQHSKEVGIWFDRLYYPEGDNIYESTEYKYLHYPKDDSAMWNSIQKGYTEITFDQFKKYVLKESIEQPKQPLKQAVHCKTQEEWDFVLEKLNYKFYPPFNVGYHDTIDFINLKESFKAYYKDYQILSFQEWCDLNGYKMEKEVKFEVGRWYKLNNCWWAKFHSLKGNLFYMSELINADFKYEKKNEGVFNTDLDSNNSIILASLEEIQRYLPVNHPDKITPGIQQARDIQSEYKVGDWIYPLETGFNCTLHFLCKNYYEKCELMQIEAFDFYNGYDVAVSTKGHVVYISEYGKKFRHATPEEINNHLISIGQIPIGIQSGSTSDNAYNHLISYGNKIHEEFFNPTVKFKRNYGYTVNPKYKQEFNIINKTKTIKF